MSVNILANLSVIMVSIVFFLLIPKEEILGASLTKIKNLVYILVVTCLCILLIYFSVVVDGIRYDYRFLMYALAIKYLGPAITLPSIVLVTMFQFFFGLNNYSWMSVAFGLIIVVTLVFFSRFLAKRTNDYWHITLLCVYELAIRSLLNLSAKQDLMYSKSIYVIVSTSGILMILVLIWLIKRITTLNEEHYFDYLTKLRNSRRFYIDLTNPYMDKEGLIISIVDVDYFKRINDTYGHIAGDKVLIKVSQVFQSRQSDAIAFYRMGGEEFACVIYPQYKEDPYLLMESIRHTVENLAIQVTNTDTISITISIGMTTMTQQTEILQAVNEADQALYEAKRTGRNRVIQR